jgi:hypothetical protein
VFSFKPWHRPCINDGPRRPDEICCRLPCWLLGLGLVDFWQVTCKSFEYKQRLFKGFGSNITLILDKVLQDPSVAAATVDQKISFLQSKNLTQEEIDLSLSRARDGAAIPKVVPANLPSYGYLNQQVTGQQSGYDYGRYPGGGFWGMPPEYVGAHSTRLAFQG